MKLVMLIGIYSESSQWDFIFAMVGVCLPYCNSNGVKPEIL